MLFLQNLGVLEISLTEPLLVMVLQNHRLAHQILANSVELFQRGVVFVKNFCSPLVLNLLLLRKMKFVGFSDRITVLFHLFSYSFNRPLVDCCFCD